MDLIAMRAKASDLEVEGRPLEALDVYRDILAHAPTNEQLLPIAVQASELSVKAGDRDAGVAMLLAAADRYANAGLGWQVIDLYQRIRRLDRTRRGLDLRLARRMLEHHHPQAARAFLADLARRFKKEKLRQMLAKMEGWSDDEVEDRLLAFLDRAEGMRGSTAVVRPAEPAEAAPSPRPSQLRGSAPPETEPYVGPARLPQGKRHPAAPPPPATTAPRRAAAIPDRPRPPAARPPQEAAVSRGQSPEPRVSLPDSVAVTAPPPVEPEPVAPLTEPAPEPSRTPEEPVVFVTPAVNNPATVPAPPRRPLRSRRTKRSRMPARAMAAVVVVLVAGGGVVLSGVWLGGERGAPETPVQVLPRMADAGGARTDPGVGNDPVPTASVPVESPPAAVETDSEGAEMGAVVTPMEAGPVAAKVVPEPASSGRPEAGVAVRSPPLALSRPLAATTTLARQPPESIAPPAVTPPPTPPAAQEVAPASSPAVAPPPAAPSFGVDYPFIMVEGLEVVEIAEEGTGAARRVAVKQVLPSGDTLALSAANLGASSVGVGRGRLLVGRHPSGGAMGTVRVGQHLVSARAPVTPEVLEPFLRKLVEVVPG